MSDIEVQIFDLKGKEIGRKKAFGLWKGHRFSPQLLHQVAVAYEANRRISRAHTKDRSERRGGGRKPWRQKGTGRARHGSRRSPLWRKGGVTFGPRAERNYTVRIPAAMRKAALAGVLVGKIRDGELIIVEEMPKISGKTKELKENLSQLPLRGSTLMLIPGSPAARLVYSRASRNLSRIKVGNPDTINVADLLRHTTVLTTLKGLEVLEKRVGTVSP